MRPSRLLLGFLLITASGVEAADPVALPAEVLVLPGAGRAGRDPTATDPVRAAIAAGKWAPPKAGDEAAGSGGRERRWVAAKLKDGTPDLPAAGGGYVYAAVRSDADRVVLLDAAGHSMVYANGEPRMGDVYRTGYVRVPVRLHEGTNHLLFAPGRGAVTFHLSEPKAAAQLHLGDTTTPDLVVDEPADAEAAVVVLNNTAEPAADLVIEAAFPDGGPVRTPVPPIPPLGVRKVGFRLAGPAPSKEGSVPVALTLTRTAGSERAVLDAATLTLRAVRATATRKRTFRSDIDGSVQYYAWVPAAPDADPKRKPGLVLSLHGASVEAIGQAACYAPKPGLHVVAPTNRRPYGFDWEDWGRLDALEVLDRAAKDLGTDPARTYLTGHSMGGHGAWHLGVTFPGRFAAVGPSAGWVSFWSYAGMRRDSAPPPERELVLRAAAPSDTLALVRNLAHIGVYVLHGDADDNVPVSQARAMRKQLGEFHPDFTYHEQPGAGHWWGNACVDWPPLFEEFARHRLPDRAVVRAVDFRTAHPGVSADCHWVAVEAQAKPFVVSHVDLRNDPAKRTFAGSTENVARLSLDLGHLPSGKPVSVTLDGQSFASVPWPAEGARVWFTRSGEKWAPTGRPQASLKGPHRDGPFKDAFRHRVLFVYGTKGTAEETAWALAKARFDAEQFWYRGNGSVDVVPDTAFDPAKEPDRSVVLYGHADMNAAWKSLLGAAPVAVGRDRLSVGDHEEEGDDLACLLVYPRPGSDQASVGAVAGTGLHGLRLTDRLPYFSSGAEYPDWTVLDPKGVRGAGYFGNDWKPAAGESVWRE